MHDVHSESVDMHGRRVRETVNRGNPLPDMHANGYSQCAYKSKNYTAMMSSCTAFTPQHDMENSMHAKSDVQSGVHTSEVSLHLIGWL